MTAVLFISLASILLFQPFSLFHRPRTCFRLSHSCLFRLLAGCTSAREVHVPGSCACARASLVAEKIPQGLRPASVYSYPSSFKLPYTTLRLFQVELANKLFSIPDAVLKSEAYNLLLTDQKMQIHQTCAATMGNPGLTHMMGFRL